jgi:formate hydrogenlyase subunit 3/multisubunit Na+/H+ antiporter MnhD subunit
MSAPIIWIIVPFVAAVVFWFIQQKQRLVAYSAAGLCLLLGMAALLQKIDSALRIGSLAINIQSTMTILGRSFVLDNADRIYLAFVYLSLFFWYLGARAFHSSSKFFPLSLAVVALLTAGLAVEPFLYSAILVELAVIISLPLLLTRGSPIGKGLLRYFIFQSLALPMIMLAGWILSGVQTSFSDMNQLYIAALLLGLGFAFWLGMFPFHMWIPEFCSENEPFTNGFVLGTLPVAVMLIILDYINGLTWLKDAAFITPALSVCGTLMVVTGGIWAAVQSDLRRIFGYGVIIESGFMLLSISLRNDLGTQLFYYTIFARALELGIFTMAIAHFQKSGLGTSLATLQGRMKAAPISSIALVVAMFSWAGVPLLASFPVRAALLGQFASTPGTTIWTLVGMGALLWAACNVLRTVFQKNSEKWNVSESTPQLLLFIFSVLALILIGFFPSLFLETVWSKISVFLTML